MSIVLSAAFSFSLVLIVVLSIAYIAALTLFLGIMERDHTQAFTDLGEPSIFRNNTPARAWKLFLYIWNAGYKSVGNRRIDRLGGALRAVLLLIVVLSIATTVVDIFFWRYVR